MCPPGRAHRMQRVKKCGISVAIVGSEDAEIHDEGVEDYTTEEEEDKFSDGEDPFNDLDDADD